MRLRSFLRTALWRLAGPAVSFIGQVYAISESRDLQYQKSLFFVLAAQVIINSTDYPYFIAARKDKPRQIHRIYLPACLFAVIAAYLSGLVPAVEELAYCLALTLAVSCFSRIYSVELQGGLARATIIGTLRNTVFTVLLISFAVRSMETLFLLAALLGAAIINRERAVRARQAEVPILSARETVFSLLAAVLTSLFFLIDRYFIVETFTEHTRLVNQVFVAISVILLLSNISAVHLSGRSTTRFVTRYAWMQIAVAAALFALAIALSQGAQERVLICFVLIATPVVFSLQSPYLLSIQERRSTASTVASYSAVLSMKIIAFVGLSVIQGGEKLVYFIPLLGLFSPLLIVVISRYSDTRYIGHP